MRESEIQRATVAFLRGARCKVFVTSRNDPGGKRTTKSLPDLLVMHPRAWTWAEMKRAKGKLRPGQAEFRELCERVGVPHEVWRDETDALEWAKRVGIVEMYS